MIRGVGPVTRKSCCARSARRCSTSTRIRPTACGKLTALAQYLRLGSFPPGPSKRRFGKSCHVCVVRPTLAVSGRDTYRNRLRAHRRLTLGQLCARAADRTGGANWVCVHHRAGFDDHFYDFGSCPEINQQSAWPINRQSRSSDYSGVPHVPASKIRFSAKG